MECSRILVEILRASRSYHSYHKHMYNCHEEELKFIREPPTKLYLISARRLVMLDIFVPSFVK